MRPMIDIIKPTGFFFLSNPLALPAFEEALKTKSPLGKKYIIYSNNILYIMFHVIFFTSLWYFHLSRYDYSNPYFDYEHFVFYLLGHILVSLIYAIIPFAILGLINAILISLIRKIF